MSVPQQHSCLCRKKDRQECLSHNSIPACAVIKKDRQECRSTQKTRRIDYSIRLANLVLDICYLAAVAFACAVKRDL